MFWKRVSPLRNPPSVLILPVISAKEDVNRPSYMIALLLPDIEIPARTIVSSFLAGRFSVVLGAGSWSDLHLRARGYVRLFCLFPTVSERKHIFFPKNDAEPARYDKTCRTPCVIVLINSPPNKSMIPHSVSPECTNE